MHGGNSAACRALASHKHLSCRCFDRRARRLPTELTVLFLIYDGDCCIGEAEASTAAEAAEVYARDHGCSSEGLLPVGPVTRPTDSPVKSNWLELYRKQTPEKGLAPPINKAALRAAA